MIKEGLMSERKLVSEEQLEKIAGGNLTYTWYGGQGTCGLNNKIGRAHV